MTTLTTPMSSHSKNINVRAVNGSHTGFKCPFHTPSGPKIGLVNHMALTCCISRTHAREDIEKFIIGIIGRQKFNRGNTGQISILINSICFTTATEDEIKLLTRALKTHPVYHDTAFIPEFCIVKGVTSIISYNIMCDGGRMHRPLFNVSKILEITNANTNAPITPSERRRLVNDFIVNVVNRGKLDDSRLTSVDILIRIGLIEMVFVIELGFYQIADNIDVPDLFSGAFRYAEINQVAMYGTNGSCAPMFNHNPGGRAIHECAMANSALTFGSTNMPSISETSSKLLLTTERAAVTTIMNEYYSRFYGNGINVTDDDSH